MLRLIIILVSFLSQNTSAWEAHYLLSHAVLGDWPEVSQEASIISQSLESFVHAQKDALVVLLKEQEAWAQQNISNYPSLPKALSFEPGSAPGHDVTKKFLLALRLNPDLNYANFLLYPSGVAHRIKNPFSPQELLQAPISLLNSLRSDQPVLEKVLPGEKVSALEILVSASEEPDHGLDLGLWQDNQTWYGALMGFGVQPFGNPALSYSSQAPFHMGYFHESRFLYLGAPWLNRCYPEYRIYTFLSLARFALSRGHHYWGYRFLGWALHYIQDLSQPYHSTLAPGTSLSHLFFVNALEKIGIKGPVENLRQLLTNRHLVLENYQFESIRSPSANKNFAIALREVSHDQQYPVFSYSYPRQIIAKESQAQAEQTDVLLRQAFPPLYVVEPAYTFTGADPLLNMREIAFGHNPSTAAKLEEVVLLLMRAFGSHTRNAVRQTVLKD